MEHTDMFSGTEWLTITREIMPHDYTFIIRFTEFDPVNVTVNASGTLMALSLAFDYCVLLGYDIRNVVSVQNEDGEYIID